MIQKKTITMSDEIISYIENVAKNENRNFSNMVETMCIEYRKTNLKIEITEDKRKNCKYPFAKLLVGQSFLIKTETQKKTQLSICASKKYWIETNIKTAKFKTKSVENGILVTRIF